MYYYSFSFFELNQIPKQSIVILSSDRANDCPGSGSVNGSPAYSLSSSIFVPSHLSEFASPARRRATRKQMAAPKEYGRRSFPGSVAKHKRRNTHIMNVTNPLAT